jgi:hypothetical protein
MRPIRQDELKDLTAYERVRSDVRRALIELRAKRRIQAGPKISIAFENRETIQYQIQEMIRAERMVDPSAIAHELETYNELLPKGLGLAGTLFIELTDTGKIREELEAFMGLDREGCVWFDLGEAGRSIARFAEGQSDESRISSVHYVQFPFDPDQATAFRDLARPAALVVDHPSYAAHAPIEGMARQALAEDLEEEA